MKEKLREYLERSILTNDDEFAVVATHVTLKSVKKHEFLIQEGERVPECFFVLTGLLKLAYTDESAKQYILSFAMEDWWECDFEAFFGQTRATMSLECLEDTTVVCLSLENFHALCDRLPKIARFFLNLSTRGHSALQRRLLSLLTIQAKTRYEQLLIRYPSLLQRVSKTMLASYLGVSRETLSRFSK